MCQSWPSCFAQHLDAEATVVDAEDVVQDKELKRTLAMYRQLGQRPDGHQVVAKPAEREKQTRRYIEPGIWLQCIGLMVNELSNYSKPTAAGIEVHAGRLNQFTV